MDLFVEKSKAYGDCDSFGARCGFQMGQDSAEMPIDTIGGYAHFCRDGLASQTFRDIGKDFKLPR